MSQLPEDVQIRPARSNRARPTARLAVAWAVFFAYVLVIEAWIGWAALIAPWQSLHPGQVALAVFLFLLSYAVRAQRLYDYLRDAMRGRWLVALRLMVIHNALNNLLPMRSGELSFPLLAKRYFALDYGRSVPALLWFRLLDLQTIATIGGTVLVSEAWSWQLAILIAVPCSLLPAVVFTVRNGLRKRVEGWHEGKLSLLTLTVLDGLPQNVQQFVRSWLLTWANWLLKLLVLAWLLMQFVEIDNLGAVMGAIGGELTSVLPIHAPAGVGTYETGIVAAILPFGASVKSALEAAVNTHLFVLGATLASAGAALLIPAPSARRLGE